MQAHDATGNRPAALRAYQRLEAILKEELSTAPAPETQAFYSQLRAAMVQ